MRPSRTTLALLSLLPLAPSPLLAEDAGSKAAAQALYDQAVKLMDEGSFAEACKKLEDSDKLFQGIGTRARLGECYAKSRRLASAWTTYRSALSAAEAKGDSRVAELRGRADALEPQLSRLRIDVPVASKTAGLRVSHDGRDVPEGLWGAPVPVDGGPHTIEASAPGRTTWKTTVTVKVDRDQAVVVVAPLVAVAEAPSASASAVPPPPASVAMAPASAAPSAAPVEASSTQRTVGLVAGGVGVVSVGVGVFFGLQTISKKNASNADGHCNAANVCDATGTALRNDGKSTATLSTVFTGLGAVGLIGGAALFLTAPSSADKRGKLQVTPSVARDGAGVHMMGSW